MLTIFYIFSGFVEIETLWYYFLFTFLNTVLILFSFNSLWFYLMINHPIQSFFIDHISQIVLIQASLVKCRLFISDLSRAYEIEIVHFVDTYHPVS